MSKLFGLARVASEFIRDRFQQKYRDADAAVEQRPGGSSAYAQRRRGLPDRLPDIISRQRNKLPPRSYPAMPGEPPIMPWDTTPGPPPVVNPPQWPPGSVPDEMQPPQPPPAEPPARKPPRPPVPPEDLPPGDEGREEYDKIQLLGRDAGYDEADFAAVMTGMRHTPGSSNVYGYFFERESRRSGILYVTFLGGREGRRAGPGPTYAYYDVPVTKAVAFQRASEASAGGAVWDYCRVRGSVWAHQHQYRLVHVNGEYVPRKVTQVGYRNRAVPSLGIGRRTYRRNTLPAQRFSRGSMDRGTPDRGSMDHGDPDRG